MERHDAARPSPERRHGWSTWRHALRPSPFLAMLLLAFPLLTLVQASDSPRQKLVLALVSYHAGDRWTESILEGLRQSLPASIAHLAVEHMDARRHDPDRLGSALADFLHKKYRFAPPDVVVAADDAALRYLRERRDALFPGAPLVWCGINAADHEDMRRLANATGVVEAVDVPAALRLIQRLQPDLRHIAVVAGASGLGAINLALFRQSRDGLPAEVSVEEWLDAPEARLPELLATLPPRSAILRLANLKTDQGGDLSTGESMRLLSSQTRAPVYTLWDFDMGQGALAGVVVNGQEQGRLAGELARRILEGASPDSLPPRLNSPNLTMADHAQALRLGIRLSALPEDATVINPPPAFPADMWPCSGAWPWP